MLMSPYDKIQELREEVFWQISSLCIRMARVLLVQGSLNSDVGNTLILVDTHEVEPVLLLHPGLVKFDFPISEGPKQALVPNVAHAIQCELRISFLKQYRFNLDIIRFGSSAIVVNQASSLQQVQSCQMSFLRQVSSLSISILEY